MLRGESELGEPWARLMVLGLALLYLGRQDAVEATLEARSCTSFVWPLSTSGKSSPSCANFNDILVT